MRWEPPAKSDVGTGELASVFGTLSAVVHNALVEGSKAYDGVVQSIVRSPFLSSFGCYVCWVRRARWHPFPDTHRHSNPNTGAHSNAKSSTKSDALLAGAL